MSKEWRNDCVSCGLPCLGDACQYRHVPYLICDDCESEYEDKLYILYGQELCSDCIESSLPQRATEDGDTEYEYEGEWLLIDEILDQLPQITIDDMLWEGKY